MRILTGNDTNYISNKKPTGRSPSSSTKDNSPLGESQTPSNTRGDGGAHYTKFIDAFWEGFETTEEIIMLNIIIKQAYYKGTDTVQLSYSLLSQYLKKKDHKTIDKAGQSLADRGYIAKTFCLGQPNMYRVNIKKLEHDFNFKITDYYAKWNITDNNE